jgi:hypothetical protein
MFVCAKSRGTPVCASESRGFGYQSCEKPVMATALPWQARREVFGMARNAVTALMLAALWVASACYSGAHSGGGAGDGTATDGGTGGSGSADDTAGEPVAPGELLDARVWRLSPTQFRNEVVALLGPDSPDGTLPDGATEHGISNIADNDGIDVGNVSIIDQTTRRIGTWAADDGAAISGCNGSYGTPACIDEFAARFAPQAFRRPVGDDEVAALRAVFDANETEHGYDYAFGSVVRTVLLSPDFIYRTEIGQPGGSGRVKLTDYEIASAISFSLTDHGPDDALMAAAAAGELSSPDERETHVRRLLSQSAPMWQRLFREWLGLTRLTTAAQGSGIDPALTALMEEEYDAFVSEVVVQQKGSLRDVFTADYTWARPDLADLYGASHPGNGLARIELDSKTRAGLFTQGAWLASHATVLDNYVVRRGMGIFRDALCTDIVPPSGIDVEEENDKLVPPDATVREAVEARAAEPVCGGCHAVPDPIGLAFEEFDHAGRLRTEYDDGRPIESDVDVPRIGPVDGGAELARLLVDDEDFQLCFVRRFTQVFVGHDMGSPKKVPWIAEAFDALLASDLSLEEFVVAFVRHDAYIERSKGGE